MSPESEQPKRKTLVEALRGDLERSKNLLARPNFPPGLARMIIGSTRSHLSQLLEQSSPVPTAIVLPEVSEGCEALRAKLEVHAARLEVCIGAIDSTVRRIFAPSLNPVVFIGHGRSLVWREVKDFVAERLQLPWEEFNRESVAGTTNQARIDEMLNRSAFALLVMTAEDEHGDGRLHARENVVHEVGLFQGRLGSRRAIILQESTCAEFSNIHGLSTLRFPPGHVSATFEDIRRAVEREGLLPV